MILPYYKIECNKDGMEKFFSTYGYFNFWDEYLIMNIKEGAGKVFTVLINRPKHEFHGPEGGDGGSKNAAVEYFKESLKVRQPEEMFAEFPELERFDYLLG